MAFATYTYLYARNTDAIFQVDSLRILMWNGELVDRDGEVEEKKKAGAGEKCI